MVPMEPAEGEDTVIRRPVPSIVDPAILDDDTIIRERVPFADVPEEAFRELAPEPVAPALVEPPPTWIEPQPSAAKSSPRVRPVAEAAPDGFHRFRVNTHEPISLDTPALVGRRPVAPRISTGAPPRLVRVPSPLHEVSGTHLELRQHGNSVVVTDLRSTNGTLVTILGAAPLKLRQGESVVVSSGTVVDIGDGNIVEILPVPRILPPNL
jgi:hypothetical protein